MHALQHLCWAPYFSGSTELDGNNAVYLRCERAGAPVPTPMDDVGYAIFERA